MQKSLLVLQMDLDLRLIYKNNMARKEQHGKREVKKPKKKC